MDPLPSTWWYTIRIPAEPSLIGLVRNSIRTALRRNDQPELTEMACLLTSELVTNGVLHADSPITVAAACTAGTLRVSVRDASPITPAPRRAAPHEETGRGLALLDGFATDWGVRPDPYGKTVWFELR